MQVLLGILLILIFSPVIAAVSDFSPLAQIGYLAFRPFCHQLEWRSFHVHGIQLAVCARCAGIYLGLFLGAAFFIFRPQPVSQWMLAMILLVALDGALNVLGILTTPAVARFLLGLGFGFYGGRILGLGVSDLEAILKKSRVQEWKTGNII